MYSKKQSILQQETVVCKRRGYLGGRWSCDSEGEGKWEQPLRKAVGEMASRGEPDLKSGENPSSEWITNAEISDEPAIADIWSLCEGTISQGGMFSIYTSLLLWFL